MKSPKIVAKGRPKGDTYYKDIASNYEKKRKKQAWWHVEQEQMAQLLDQLPDGMSVVDIPFGTGRFVPMYRKKGFKIAGLDASEDMISTAQKILGSDFDVFDDLLARALRCLSHRPLLSDYDQPETLS